MKQIKRLSQYVRVKKYNGEHIKCDKIFFNYSLGIIDNVEANEYIQVIHADYKAQDLKIKLNPKITKYIGVSKQVCESFKELTGRDIELVYNPIKLDKPKRVLNLISATRLTKEKGKERIVALSKILDEANIPYMWIIFTDDMNAIKNPNIIYMKPRLDISNYIANADYLVQLSDNEGYCYSVIESLILGTPVIVTKCPVFDELGINDKENGYLLDFDMKNVPIEDIYYKIPEFEYKPKLSGWNKYLSKGESTYKNEFKKQETVQCIRNYFDEEFNKDKFVTDKPYKVSKARARILEDAGVAKILEK